ncbi:unnamed protein product, partial [Ectocarpus fasciculatus]
RESGIGPPEDKTLRAGGGGQPRTYLYKRRYRFVPGRTKRKKKKEKTKTAVTTLSRTQQQHAAVNPSVLLFL